MQPTAGRVLIQTDRLQWAMLIAGRFRNNLSTTRFGVVFFCRSFFCRRSQNAFENSGFHEGFVVQCYRPIGIAATPKIRWPHGTYTAASSETIAGELCLCVSRPIVIL